MAMYIVFEVQLCDTKNEKKCIFFDFLEIISFAVRI